MHNLRAVAFLLCLALCGQQAAMAAIDDPTLSAQSAQDTVRRQLTHKGVGHQVRLIRADGSEVRGRIVNLGSNAVDLRVLGTSSVSTVMYAQVTQVKNPGLSTGAKVGIGVGIGVVAVVGIAAIVINHELSKPW